MKPNSSNSELLVAALQEKGHKLLPSRFPDIEVVSSLVNQVLENSASMSEDERSSWRTVFWHLNSKKTFSGGSKFRTACFDLTSAKYYTQDHVPVSGAFFPIDYKKYALNSVGRQAFTELETEVTTRLKKEGQASKYVPSNDQFLDELNQDFDISHFNAGTYHEVRERGTDKIMAGAISHTTKLLPQYLIDHFCSRGMDPKDIFVLRKLVVRPDKGGNGYATLLLRNMFNRGFKNGYAYASLTVDPINNKDLYNHLKNLGVSFSEPVRNENGDIRVIGVYDFLNLPEPPPLQKKFPPNVTRQQLHDFIESGFLGIDQPLIESYSGGYLEITINMGWKNGNPQIIITPEGEFWPLNTQNSAERRIAEYVAAKFQQYLEESKITPKNLLRKTHQMVVNAVFKKGDKAA